MPRFYFLLVALLSAILPLSVSAQLATIEADTSAALANTIAYYRGQVQDDSFLYEGREYRGFSNRFDGHAFFETSEWQTGNLLYKGRYYTEVPMLYDIVTDEVVVRHYGGLFRIKLSTQEVAHFSLQEDDFIFMSPEEAKNSALNSGFYQLLYVGESQVLAKRKKILLEFVDEMKVRYRFDQKNTYYIKKGEQYYTVKSRSAALKVLNEHKKEIRRHLQKSGIRFNRNPEAALIEMVNFYDQATTTNP